MYQIEITESSKRFLKKLPKTESEIILNKVYSLRDNPFRFLKRLQVEKLWRLRIGDYRAVIDIVVVMNKIIVVRIGHRKNIYN